MSIVDRCRDIRREFPTIKMNPTLLRQVYSKFKIKKKKFRWYKTAKSTDEDKTKQALTTMKRLITQAKNAGYRFIYIDETMFTRQTCQETEWARPKENMAIDLAKLDEPTLAVLSGVSKEKGQEYYQIFDFSVNVEKFIEYITTLRKVNGTDKICLFMDNLSAHKSEKSKQAMRELGFRWIYNLPYEPRFNPIELVFSQVKRNFKALRARKLMGLIQDSHESMISQAIQSVKKKDV